MLPRKRALGCPHDRCFRVKKGGYYICGLACDATWGVAQCFLRGNIGGTFTRIQMRMLLLSSRTKPWRPLYTTTTGIYNTVPDRKYHATQKRIFENRTGTLESDKRQTRFL